MFRRLKPGCPLACGTCRRPGCADQLLSRALLLLLVVVLVVSLWMGLNSLSESACSSSITEASPFARPETVQLTSQALDDAGERIVGNPHRKSAVPANVPVEVSQEG